MTMKTLTHRELRLRYTLAAIRQHMRRYRHSPTNIELARVTGMARTTISQYITDMEQRGWLTVTRTENNRQITINPEAPTR